MHTTCFNVQWDKNMFNKAESEKQILDYCAECGSISPLNMARELMAKGVVRLHGPEHHFLTAAVLTAAWYRIKGEDPRPHLEKLLERCTKIAPAVCGYYGVCGDSMGAGAFLSEALEVSYLSEESWAILNKFTGRVQSAIGASCERGPRCCKRTTYAAIVAAEQAVEALLGVEMDDSCQVYCGFYMKNSQCVGTDCAFYPPVRVMRP